MSVDPDSPAGMGLLNYLSAHALDDDYAELASRADPGTGDAGPAPRPSGSGWLLGLTVMIAFALLLYTAATQTSHNAVAEHQESQALTRQIQARKARLDRDRATMDRLTRQSNQLRNRLRDNGHLSQHTRHELTDLALAAGTTEVRGPGVVVRVDDAPGSDNARSTVLDTDLQQLANGLWQAGAEAIAINGQRLTNLSSIRQAGSAITVNYTSLSRPYTVRAIGDPATLPARLAETAGGRTWLDLRRQVGLRFSIRAATHLRLPAAPQPTLRYARAPGTRADTGQDGNQDTNRHTGEFRP